MMQGMMNPLELAPRWMAESSYAQAGQVVPVAGAPLFAESLAAAKVDDETQADGVAGVDDAHRERERARLREASEQLVATAFVMPMLAKMRDSTLGSDMFHGGQAEDMFNQQLDTLLSEEIVRGSNLPIVDAVEKFIAARAGLDEPAEKVRQGVDRHG